MLKNVIVAVTGLIFLSVLIPNASKDSNNKAQVLGTGTETPALLRLQASPEIADHVLPPTLTAKAALAVDLNSEALLYTFNFDEKLPIASLTKLMTALVAMEKLKLADEVTVQREDTFVVGSSMGLVPDEKILVHDLLKGLLISSSNDAAKALATAAGGEKVFVGHMNEYAKKLNLYSTRFTNPVGYDHEDNYSTANDLIKIVKEFLNYPTLSEIVQTREERITSVDKIHTHKLRSTNKLLLEDQKIVGIKTGFTSVAQGNLIIRAKEDGKDVVTVVLGSANREEDSRKLLEWLFQVYRW